MTDIDIIKKLEQKRDGYLEKVKAINSVIEELQVEMAQPQPVPKISLPVITAAPSPIKITATAPNKELAALLSRPVKAAPAPAPAQPRKTSGRYDYEELTGRLKALQQPDFSHMDLARVCNLNAEQAKTVMQQLIQYRHVKKLPGWGRYALIGSAPLFTPPVLPALQPVTTVGAREEEEQEDSKSFLSVVRPTGNQTLGFVPEQTPLAQVTNVSELEVRLAKAVKDLTEAQKEGAQTRCAILTDKIKIINQRIEALKKL